MWLHPAENIRLGARHHQVDPQIRCVHHSPSLPNNTMTRLWRDMVPDASRCPDDVRMSESGKQVLTCFS